MGAKRVAKGSLKKTDKSFPKKARKGGKKLDSKDAGTGKGKSGFGKGKKQSTRGAKKK